VKGYCRYSLTYLKLGKYEEAAEEALLRRKKERGIEKNITKTQNHPEYSGYIINSSLEKKKDSEEKTIQKIFYPQVSNYFSWFMLFM
jgi:hypothetical protein